MHLSHVLAASLLACAASAPAKSAFTETGTTCEFSYFNQTNTTIFAFFTFDETLGVIYACGSHHAQAISSNHTILSILKENRFLSPHSLMMRSRCRFERC